MNNSSSSSSSCSTSVSGQTNDTKQFIAKLRGFNVSEPLLKQLLQSSANPYQVSKDLCEAWVEIETAKFTLPDEFIAAWTSEVINDDLAGMRRLLLQKANSYWEEAAGKLLAILEKLKVFAPPDYQRNSSPSFFQSPPVTVEEFKSTLRYLILNVGAPGYEELEEKMKRDSSRLPELNNFNELDSEILQLLLDYSIISDAVGFVDKIDKLLDMGVGLGPLNHSLNRALFSGASSALIIMLIELGAPINEDTLNCALFSNVEEPVFESLIKAGAKFNEQTFTIIDFSSQTNSIREKIKGVKMTQEVSHKAALDYCKQHLSHYIAKYCQPTGLVKAIEKETLHEALNALGIDEKEENKPIIQVRRGPINNDDDDVPYEDERRGFGNR